MPKKENIVPPVGFVAGGISAGIKSNGKKDLGIILCERPTVTAATLTINRFQAAPVQLCRRRLSGIGRQIRGVIVNSGNANALTGEPGYKDAQAMAEAAERATGCPPGSFLVCSTGIIGHRLPLEKITDGAPKLVGKLSAKGWNDFAEAIMTTDLVSKMASRTIPMPDGSTCSIIGVCKGSGMIMPCMATMLAFIATDFPVAAGKVRQLLRQAVEVSFNSITVDGQMSTNDTVLLMSSNGLSRKQTIEAECEERFQAALVDLCQDLAQRIVRDGEGATKFVTITVSGATSREKARKLAMAIGNSNLVKTALHGGDPNWGRITQAMGQAGIPFSVNQTAIQIQGVPVLKGGLPAAFDRPKLVKAMKSKEILIEAQIGSGGSSATIWTCDLTEDYIKINTAYN